SRRKSSNRRCDSSPGVPDGAWSEGRTGVQAIVECRVRVKENLGRAGPPGGALAALEGEDGHVENAGALAGLCAVGRRAHGVRVRYNLRCAACAAGLVWCL